MCGPLRLVDAGECHGRPARFPHCFLGRIHLLVFACERSVKMLRICDPSASLCPVGSALREGMVRLAVMFRGCVTCGFHDCEGEGKTNRLMVLVVVELAQMMACLHTSLWVVPVGINPMLGIWCIFSAIALSLQIRLVLCVCTAWMFLI